MAFDWKKVVRGAAPALAAALGGPAAGVAMAAISRATLGKPDGNEDEIAAALATGDPAHLIELTKENHAFAVEMARLAVAGATLDAQDRASARDMYKNIHSRTPDVISYIVIVMFCAELITSHFVPVPPANHDSALRVADLLHLAVATVLGFWLGGSLMARQTIGQALEKK